MHKWQEQLPCASEIPVERNEGLESTAPAESADILSGIHPYICLTAWPNRRHHTHMHTQSFLIAHICSHRMHAHTPTQMNLLSLEGKHTYSKSTVPCLWIKEIVENAYEIVDQRCVCICSVGIKIIHTFKDAQDAFFTNARLLFW